MGRHFPRGVLLAFSLACVAGCARHQTIHSSDALADSQKTTLRLNAPVAAASGAQRTQRVTALAAVARPALDSQRPSEAQAVIDRDYAAIMNWWDRPALRNQDGVAYRDLMVFPENWPADAFRPVGETDSPANHAARDRLEGNLKELVAEGHGLQRVMDYLRDDMGGNIFVNWQALTKAGIDRNTPVTITLRDVTFRHAITTILEQVGGEKGSLGYTIDEGIITISTKEDLSSSKYQVVRVFDVRDLIEIQMVGERDADLARKDREESIASLMQGVRNAVDPQSWRDADGTVGSIRELNGQLIVIQTVDNQATVKQYLNGLRSKLRVSPEPKREP